MRLSRQRRLNLAMLVAGLGSFSLMYSPQPVLPLLADAFGVSAATAGLAVAATTGPLAVFILVAGLLSDRIDKPRLMTASLLAAAALTILSVLTANWPLFIGLRAVIGVCLAGVPAVAMAYLSEESLPEALGPGMGLYVAGTAIGGMTGRLGVGLVSDLLGWRWGVALLGLAALGLALAFAALLPAPGAARDRAAPAIRMTGRQLVVFLKDGASARLFGLAFLFMGAFVTVYNYAGFHLEEPPFGFSPSQIGLIFSLYLLGSLASVIAGRLSGPLGRGRLLIASIVVLLAGVVVTGAASAPLVIAGIALVTLGFFAAHGLASGWIGARAAQLGGGGAALYLFFYYLGSSLLGALGGLAWDYGRWTGIMAYAGVIGLAALGLAFDLARTSKVR